MARSANQKLKLLYLCRILMEQTDEDHPLSVQELIAQLAQYNIQAERKSIYDDLDALARFGVDVQCRKGRSPGWFVGGRDFELPELKLLVDAVQSSRFITRKKSDTLIRKLERLASVYQARQLQRQVFVSGRIKVMNESIYYNVDEIHRAISQNRQISFQYTEWTVPKERHLKKGGARYQISPWQMIWQDGNYYLIGVDEKSGIVKHYRVDKMLKILTENEARNGAELFRKFDSARFAAGTFGMFGGREEKVNLEFKNHLVGVMIDRFGQDIMIMSKDNEHSVTRVQVNVSTQFYGWLAALGNSVRVISPENVRKEYRDFLRKALENYEG